MYKSYGLRCQNETAIVVKNVCTPTLLIPMCIKRCASSCSISRGMYQKFY